MKTPSMGGFSSAHASGLAAMDAKSFAVSGRSGRLEVGGKQYKVTLAENGAGQVSRAGSKMGRFFASAKRLMTPQFGATRQSSNGQRMADAWNHRARHSAQQSPVLDERLEGSRGHPGELRSRLTSANFLARLKEAAPVSRVTSSKPDALEYLRAPMLKAAMNCASGGSVGKAFIHSNDNQIHSIDLGGGNIFDAQAKLIKQAKSEVLLQTFQWEPNSSGANAILDALQALVDRPGSQDHNGKVLGEDGKPIKVRILLDDLTKQGAKYMWPNAERPDLSNPDVLLGVNQPWCQPGRESLLEHFDFELRVHQHTLANTLHSKTLVVDGKQGAITGANVQERNHAMPEGFKEAGQKVTQFDLGMTLEGSAVKGMRQDFVHYWNRSTNKQLATQPLANTPIPEQSKGAGVEMALLTKAPNINPLTTSTSNPQDAAILAAIHSSKEKVSILSSNFNTPALAKALAQAADRGVKVEILVHENANDNRLGNPISGKTNTQAYQGLRNLTKHQQNLDLRYYQPIDQLKSEAFATAKDQRDMQQLKPISTHAKVTIIDDKVALVGSGNMDKTSWHFAGETNLAIFDADKTQALYQRVFSPLWKATDKANLAAEVPPPSNGAQVNSPAPPKHIQDLWRFLEQDE